MSFLIIFLIIIFLIKKRENYNTGTTTADLQPQIVSLGRDINIATFPVGAGSGAVSSLNPGDLNRYVWSQSGFNGFRKMLKPGGNGPVWYFTTMPTDTELTVTPAAISGPKGISIPQYIIYAKSKANPLLDKNCVYTRTTACTAGFNVDTYSITTQPQAGGTCTTPSGLAITSPMAPVTTSVVCSCNSAASIFKPYSYPYNAYCISCTAGNYMPNATTCTPCPAMKTCPINSTLSTQCVSCTSGNFSLLGSGCLPANTIITIAGTGDLSRTITDIPAKYASIGPAGIAVDSSGNIYICDINNTSVRKVSASTGLLSNVAFGSTDLAKLGMLSDGGLATAASVFTLEGIAVDSSANMYIIADGIVRKVTASTGIISTIAGGKYLSGYSGDGGPATDAQFMNPSGIALDTSGNIYIADTGNSVIRKITKSTGIISTVSFGAGVNLSFPRSVAIDASGNLYVADTGKCVIRKLSSGVTTTVAGIGGISCSNNSGDGGLATSANLYSPKGVVVDASGNIYISTVNRIRKVTASTGIISTITNATGNAGYSGDGGPATSALLNSPEYLCIDSSLNLYISDKNNFTVRVILSTS